MHPSPALSIPFHLLFPLVYCSCPCYLLPTHFKSLCVTLCIDMIVIEKVWKVALDTGANVLALNVLEAQASDDRLNSERNSLNDKIANHQEAR